MFQASNTVPGTLSFLWEQLVYSVREKMNISKSVWIIQFWIQFPKLHNAPLNSNEYKFNIILSSRSDSLVCSESQSGLRLPGWTFSQAVYYHSGTVGHVPHPKHPKTSIPGSQPSALLTKLDGYAIADGIDWRNYSEVQWAADCVA